MLWRQVEPRDAAEPLVDLVYARLDPGADVVRPARVPLLQREQIGTGHVLDKDVVARLLP
jgi:hypothetical protein